MNPFATFWVGLITIIFILPTTPGGRARGATTFDWNVVNYAPLVTGGVLLGVGLWWSVSAKNWFKGPKHTITEIDQRSPVPSSR